MRPSSHNPLSYWFDLLARISFALTIIFAPLRWRIVLWQRPVFPVYGDYTDFLLFATDVTLVCTLIFWGSSFLLAPRRITFGSASIWIFLAGLTLAGFVSTFGGEDYVLSRYQSIRLVFLFLFYLYIVNEITLPEWVIVPVGLQVILQSVAAIGQSLLQHSVGLFSLGELRLDPAKAGISVIPVGELRFLRAYGLADHPNILGGCLAFGLVLLLAVLIYGRNRSRWLALTAFLPGLLALVMTFSRSAWIGFFIGASFMVGLEAFARRWDSVKRMIVLGSLSMLLAAPFVMKNIPVFGSRVNSGNISSDDPMRERMFLIRAGNTIFVEHSTIGIGLGASPLAMKSRFADFPTNFQPPHYTLLVAAMETGVFGAAFYFLLLITPLFIFASHWRLFAGQPLMIGTFALLLAMTVVGLFDYYTWLNAAGRTWQWLAWGLWSAAYVRDA